MALSLSAGTSLGLALVLSPEPNDEPPPAQRAVVLTPQPNDGQAARRARLAPPVAPPARSRSLAAETARAQAAKRIPPRPPVVYRKFIRVDMARREVAVYEDGELVKLITYAGFGRTGHETPRLRNASLSISRRERMHYSRRYDDAPMPYALFLNESPGVAFHAGNVGGRSHGCIRLRTQDAKWLFNWVRRDPVRVDIRAGRADRPEVALERRKLSAAETRSAAGSDASEPIEKPGSEGAFGDAAEASLPSAPPKFPAAEAGPEESPR